MKRTSPRFLALVIGAALAVALLIAVLIPALKPGTPSGSSLPASSSAGSSLPPSSSSSTPPASSSDVSDVPSPGTTSSVSYPHLPSPTAVSGEELRTIVVNQALRLSTIEWQSEKRIARLRHSETKTAAMRKVGALPTSYFEFNRSQIPYLGVVMDQTSGSYEKFLSQMAAGVLLKQNEQSDYYGMNAEAYLVDLVSRVSPTPITGMKQAMTTDAMTALLPGADITASTSKEAMAGAAAADIESAYAKLNVGDLLIAWDDSITDDSAPAMHVMVVTAKDDLNTGHLTVTYPAYLQPIYYFTCDTCGFQSSEGPTSAILTEHLISKDSKFVRFAKHSEIVPDTTCTGSFVPNGSTTWYTNQVSFDQLLGEQGGVPGGNTHYLPYTLPVYDTGTSTAQVKVTTDITPDTLSAGFTAKIESNFRITQVDVVLSRSDKKDETYSLYPEWTDWTFDFNSPKLDYVLSDNLEGSCSLVMYVHTGPTLGTSDTPAGVIEVFRLDASLEAPSFNVVARDSVIYPGEPAAFDILTAIDGVTAASVTLDYAQAGFLFDAETTAQTAPDTKFTDNGDGTVTFLYSGNSVSSGTKLGELYFVMPPTGDISGAVTTASLSSTGAALSIKPGAGTDKLSSARADTAQSVVTLSHSVQIIRDYAAGNDLLLVFTESEPAKVTYSGVSLTEVSLAHYQAYGKEFSHTYAFVSSNIDLSKIALTPMDSTALNVLPYLLEYTGDVNQNNTVDISDVQVILNIINGTLEPQNNQKQWLLADIDKNGTVNMDDVNALLAQLAR